MTTEALRSDAFCPLALGMFERVESTSNRLPADAELECEVCLVLAGTNTAADSLDIRVGQLGGRGHTFILLSWDIWWDIWESSLIIN